MRQGASIRRRMLAAFVLLALGMGLTLGLVGLFSYCLLYTSDAADD